MTNKEAFAKAYRENLARAVTERPDDYSYIAGKVDVVADKMLAAIERGSANKDGYAFKQTCKQLGIKHTYKAINEYLAA
jgi:hypothetical protein